MYTAARAGSKQLVPLLKQGITGLLQLVLHVEPIVYIWKSGAGDTAVCMHAGQDTCINPEEPTAASTSGGADPLLKDNIIFVGNPGSGKSTLLNALMGDVRFKSGLSFGGGLTKTFQAEEADGTWYIDTPGLEDVTMREAAAEQIKAALKQSGQYRIFFVVLLDSGRVRAGDVASMTVILDALKDTNVPVQHGIIVNKATKGVMEAMLEDRGALEEAFKAINSGMLPTGLIGYRFLVTQWV